MKMVGSKAF
uniref:Uncharacterized protein n=1 Tax=Romanomermis culicivorax TaxID=13658 RepID=A0A915KAD3_ROMCU